MSKPFVRPTAAPVRLECWAVHKAPFAAPETPEGRIYLSGAVYGYPGRPDGERITTGHVYDAEGRTVYGRRTVYLLGEPDPRYLDYLTEKGIPFDPERPVRMVRDSEAP